MPTKKPIASYIVPFVTYPLIYPRSTYRSFCWAMFVYRPQSLSTTQTNLLSTPIKT